MKNTILILIFTISSLNMFSQQTSTYGDLTNGSFGQSVFLDASAFETGVANEARGLTFPRTNLQAFTFVTQEGDGFATFLTGYDGTIVYNTVTGTTPVTGSGIGGQSVVPGFYYFSNPSSTGDSATGRWIPIGSASNNVVKTKEVLVTTPLVYTEAKLNLGTTVIGADEVGTFLGAKIYEGGKLVMSADSDYVTSTNVLTTGNGYMYQVLKANTEYKVVVEYK